MSGLDGFSLDLKLGGRMLVKYPGLTMLAAWRPRSALALSSSKC